MAGCATDSSRVAMTNGAPEVPAPSKDEKIAVSLTAKGFQIYECRAKQSDATQFEWGLKAPEADLFDRAGRKVGTHSKGPRWDHIDGSSVIGENPRPYGKDTNAIPWLLLGVKKAEGSGIFGKVTSIQRVNTVGGKAPSSGCDMSTVGKEIRVPYTATYHFYVAKP